MKGHPLLGCAAFLLRSLLVGLIMLSTIWTLGTTFLVNLNSRPSAMALVTEAGAEFLTPALSNQDVVKAGYQDVETQAAQPSGQVYFPFVRVPIPAKEIAGKSMSAVLGVVYTHLAIAYYDTGDLGSLFGLTPPQQQLYSPYLKQVCAQVAAATKAGASLPPGADLSAVLNTLFGQSGSGSGAGSVTPEQAKAELSAMQQLCASVQSGKALTLNDLTSMLNTVSAASGAPGASAGSGGIPQIPTIANNPIVSFLGLSSPLSAKAENQATNLQRWGLGVSVVLTLLLVLLSRRFGRLAWPAIGVLLGGGAILGVIGGVVVIWSRNMDLFQPHAALLHLLGDQIIPVSVGVAVAGGLGILGAIVGTIVMQVMAAHAGTAAASAAAGAGAGREPALVPAYGRPQVDSFAAGWGHPSPAAPGSASVQTTLPLEPGGPPTGAPAPRFDTLDPSTAPAPGPQPASASPDGPTDPAISSFPPPDVPAEGQ